MTAGREEKSRTAFRRTAGVFIAAVFSAGWARSQTETGNTAGSLSERGTREPRGDGRIGNTRGSKMSNELLRQQGRACKTGPVFLSVGQKERLRGGRKQTGGGAFADRAHRRKTDLQGKQNKTGSRGQTARLPVFCFPTSETIRGRCRQKGERSHSRRGTRERDMGCFPAGSSRVMFCRDAPVRERGG